MLSQGSCFKVLYERSNEQLLLLSQSGILMSSIRKTSTKILFLNEVSVVRLTANLLVTILPSKTLFNGGNGQFSSWKFCTKHPKGVFRTQSQIQDGVFAKKVNGFKYFCKKARCFDWSLNMPSSSKVCENATFKQILRNFA